MNEGVFPRLDYLVSRPIGDLQDVLRLQYQSIEIAKYYTLDQRISKASMLKEIIVGTSLGQTIFEQAHVFGVSDQSNSFLGCHTYRKSVP